MTIRLACPHCGAALGLPDHLSGKPVRCGKCAQLIAAAPPAVGRLETATLPAKPGPSPAVKVKPGVARVSAAPRPAASAPNTRAPSLGSAALVGALVGLLVVVVGLTGGYFLFFRGTANLDRPVQVVEANTDGAPAANAPDKQKGRAATEAAKQKVAPVGAGNNKNTDVKAKVEPGSINPKRKPIDVKYITADFSAAVVVQPRSLMQAPLVASLLPPPLMQALSKEAGISPDQIEEVIVLLQSGAAVVAAPPPAKETWVAVESKEGRFSLRFPVKPAQSSRKTPLGTRQVFAAEDKSGAWVYEISYVDFPANSPIIGDQSRVDYATRALEFKPSFKDKKDIKLGRLPGSEVILDDAQLKTYSVHRVYIAGDRLYHLEATARTTQKPPADFARFFDSFQVAGAEAAPPGELLPLELLPIPAAIVRFADPIDGKTILSRLLKGVRQADHQGKVYYLGPEDEGLFGLPIAGHAADERTLLLAPEPTLKKMLTAVAEKSPLAERLRQIETGDDLTMIILVEPYRQLLKALTRPSLAVLPPELRDIAPLADRILCLTATASLSSPPLARLAIETDGAESAQLAEKLVQSAFGMVRQVYPEMRAGLIGQLPPPVVPSVLRLTDQFYSGVRISREAARVSVTVDQPSALDLPEGLIAASGFNDAKGLLSDPVPESPFALEVNNREGGIGEPGWAGPWPKHPAATFQKKVVFEGDGALYLTGAPNIGPNYARYLTAPQTESFQLDYHVQVPAGSSLATYLQGDPKPGHNTGPNWGIGQGRFSVRDRESMVDTGFACKPGQWYKVTVRANVPQRTWDFAVDDKRFVPKRPLRFREDVTFVNRLNFLVEGGVYIDDIRFTRLPAGE